MEPVYCYWSWRWIRKLPYFLWGWDNWNDWNFHSMSSHRKILSSFNTFTAGHVTEVMKMTDNLKQWKLIENICLPLFKGQFSSLKSTRCEQYKKHDNLILPGVHLWAFLTCYVINNVFICLDSFQLPRWMPNLSRARV